MLCGISWHLLLNCLEFPLCVEQTNCWCKKVLSRLCCVMFDVTVKFIVLCIIYLELAGIFTWSILFCTWNIQRKFSCPLNLTINLHLHVFFFLLFFPNRTYQRNSQRLLCGNNKGRRAEKQQRHGWNENECRRVNEETGNQEGLVTLQVCRRE